MTATCRWTTSPTWPSRTRTDRARATDQDCDEGAPQGPIFHAAGERPATPIFRLHGSGAAHIRPPTRAADDASRTSGGAIAQLVERLNGIQEVRGSTPLGSTSIAACFRLQTAAWPAPSGSRPTVCPRRIVALPTVLDGTLRGFRLSGSAAGTTAFAAQVFSQSFCEPSFRVRVCRTVRKLEERGNLGVQSSVGRKRIGKEQSQSR